MIEVLIAIGLAAAGYVVSEVIGWMDRKRILQENNENAKPVINPAILRSEDHKMIEQTQVVFHEVFGNDLLGRVSQMDAQQRVENLPILIERLTQAYGIPNVNLELNYEENTPCMGGYCRSNNTLMLNIAFMMTNDKEWLWEFYDTIVHELRHAIQSHIIITPGFAGASQELRADFAYGMKHYVRYNKDPQGYYNQLIEMDAFTFAYEVMEGICK